MKFRNFNYIAGLENAGLALALATIGPETKEGLTLFGAFPEALTEKRCSLSPTLIEKLKPFGLWRLVAALKGEYQIMRIVHRSPQNDYYGLDRQLPGLHLVTIKQLRSGAFTLNDKEWRVFGTEPVYLPFPYSRPDREDRHFYCAAADLVTEIQKS